MVDIFRFELKSNLRPKPPHIPHSRQNSILPCFINLPYFFIFNQKRKALSNRDRVHLVRSGWNSGFVEPPTHTGLLNSDLVPHLLHDREQNSKKAKQLSESELGIDKRVAVTDSDYNPS